MTPTFSRRLLDSAAIDAADAQALVASARTLKRQDAELPTRLRGKNMALLCAEPEGACARRFDAVASALGLRVARITPSPAWLRDDMPLGAETARLLENLYNGVDCEELPAGFARRLQAQLGVPVYDGLARDDHPLFDLLPQLVERGHTADDDDRRALVQAALLSTLT